MTKKIQFGVNIPTFPLDGSSHGEIFCDQIFAFLDRVHTYYDSAWVTDHFVPWYEAIDPATDTLEALTTLIYLAGKYPRLTLGNIVLSQSYRPPALLAKMAATLQTLSKGRFILGIGAGWKEDEYLAYGYNFPSTATRIHQLKEAVQVIRLMWTEKKATFHGRYYHIEEAICEPKPDPLPPLLIGGGGRKLTLRVVAEYADWWNFPGGSAENYRDLLDVLRGHCQAVGRDYGSIVKTWSTDCVAIAPSLPKARLIAQSNPLSHFDGSIIGDPDEITNQLNRFTELGVQHFILRFADFPKTDGALLFAKEVIPRLVGKP